MTNNDLIKLLQALPPEEEVTKSLYTIEKYLLDSELFNDIRETTEIISDIVDAAREDAAQEEEEKDPHTDEHDFIPNTCFDKIIWN